MANVKKYSDIKVLTDNDINKNGIPRDFWNYTVNIVTGFSTHETRYDKDNRENADLNKYGVANSHSSSKMNGKIHKPFTGGGAEDFMKV